jgi:hypothetical protein
VTWQSESCPKGLTAITRVWAQHASTSCRAPRANDCGIPTDPPSCVIANANSRLRQLAAHPFTAESISESARAKRKHALCPSPSLTKAPPHSP